MEFQKQMGDLQWFRDLETCIHPILFLLSL